MAISNSQYDEIMRDYDQRQLRNRQLLEERTHALYAQAPELRRISHAISSASMSSARRMLFADGTALEEMKEELRQELDQLRAQKAALLQGLGYPADYLEPIYDCPDCRDTGYQDGQRCHCLRQAIIDVVYSQSNIRAILEKENFSTFSYEYYSSDKVNRITGLSSLETMQKAVAVCQRFIRDFDQKPKNLLLYGDTGVGKTFLSNCVAKELLDRGYSVVYFSAFQMFDVMSKGVFDRDTDAIAANQNIFDCDLLIIDDLGTELPNSFTTGQLFLCVNERILRGKSTIISTNLSMQQILDTYSERTLSRISSNYTVLKLFGDDIRLKKRR